jgi:hypothetical protein
MAFHATVDMGDLPTLGDRMADHFKERLVVHLGAAARLIVEAAKAQLVPGHGYDTGKMHDTLTAVLVNQALVAADAVFYDLESPEAFYWVFVEFGHMMRNGQWWEGYHFLQNAVVANETRIRSAVRAAWADTVQVLGAESRVLRGGGRIRRVAGMLS